MCGTPQASIRISAGCSRPSAAIVRRRMGFTSSAIAASCMDLEGGPPGRDLVAIVDRNVAELQQDALALGWAQEDEVILSELDAGRAFQHRASAIVGAEAQALGRDRPRVAVPAVHE